MSNDRSTNVKTPEGASRPDDDRPPTPPDAGSVHADLCEVARGLMTQYGNLDLCAHVCLESGASFPILLQNCGEPDAREAFADRIRLLTMAVPTRYVAISMEAWMLAVDEPPHGEPPPIPSQSDRREEVVMLTCEWSGGATASWIHAIERDENGDVVGLRHRDDLDSTQFDGRFANLLPPPEMMTARIRGTARIALRQAMCPVAEEIFKAADGPRPDPGSSAADPTHPRMH